MGIVYEAEDTRLDRKVAIKVLPSAALASESDRARFYREAKAAASLNHPHIAAIYEIDEAVPSNSPHGIEPSPFIAMEFVDGDALSDIIESGPLKLSRVVSIGSEIAGALGAAHEEHIVHRDIKSANIMLSGRGAAKVLDFGLAQTMQSTKLTQEGATVGTIAYMSPEQARGEAVDSRTDIWALGVVLYEMVTGQQPFPGEYQQAVVYSILNTEPEPITAVRTGVPMELERIIGKCLKKDKENRYQHAADLVADLRGLDLSGSGPIGKSATTFVQASSPAPKNNNRLVGIAVGVLGFLALAVWFFLIRTPEYTISVSSVNRVTVEDGLVFDPTIHPDGDLITYSAEVDGVPKLFFRSVAGGPPTPVASDFERYQLHAEYSPDGSRLIFQHANTIYLVDAPRGVPTPLFAGGSGGELRTPTWSPNGERISMVKGDSLIVLDIQSRTYNVLGNFSNLHSPAWSPDGNRLVAVAGGSDQLNPLHSGRTSRTKLMMYSEEQADPIVLLDDEHQNMSPIWTPDGEKILFTSSRGGGHDVWSINVSGSPDLTRITTGFNFFVIGLSRDGRTLVASESYVTGQNLHKVSHLSAERSRWDDALPVTTGEQQVESVAVSPDGKWIAYGSNISGDINIYLMPLPEGPAVQVTRDPAFDFVSGWSPDSKSIVFYSLRNGTRDVFSASISDLSIRPIFQSEDNLWFPSMSSDGKLIGYARGSDPFDFETIRKREDGSWGDPRLVASGLNTINTFSPVKNLLALSEEGLGIAIVDISINPPRELHRANVRGRSAPVWSPDGNTLFSLRGLAIIAYDLKTSENRTVFSTQGGPQRGTLSFAADNEFLYFTKIEQITNIWVLNLAYE